MKNTALFLILTLFYTSNAQYSLSTFNEKRLPEKKALDIDPGYNMKLNTSFLYSSDNSRFIVINYSDNKNKPSVTIEVFDKNKALVKTNKFSPKINNSKAFVMGGFMINNKPHLIMGVNKTTTFSVYVDEIDANGSPSNNPSLIKEFKVSADKSGKFAVKALSMKNWIGVDKKAFQTVTSKNGKHIGISYRSGSMGAKEFPVYLVSLDNNKNSFSKEFKVEINTIDFLNEGMYVSNNGSIVFNYSEKKQKNSLGIPLDKVNLGLLLSKSTNKKVFYNDFFNKNLIYETFTSFDSDNNPVFFYTFRKKANADDLSGFGIVALDNNFKVTKKKESLISKKSLSKYGIKKFEKDYEPINLLIKPNNEKLVVLERFGTRSLMKSAYKTHENFLNREEAGKVAILSFSNNNSFVNLKELTKTPFGANLNDCQGVYSTVENNNLSLFYNSLEGKFKKNSPEEFNNIIANSQIYTKDFQNSTSISDNSSSGSKIHPYSITKLKEGLFFAVTSNIKTKKQYYAFVSKNGKSLSLEKSISNNKKSDDTTFNLKIPEGGSTAITSSSTIAEDEEASEPVRELKYKADESEVDKYRKLRVKFDAESKKKEMREKLAKKKQAVKDQKEFEARHLKPGQAEQFNKHRYGKNENASNENTTSEEDFKSLFE